MKNLAELRLRPSTHPSLPSKNVFMPWTAELEAKKLTFLSEEAR
jgi:hypothetical protein